MRARMLAAFAFGFALGALCLGVGLWRSGSLVTAAARKTEAPPAINLPEPTTGNSANLISDLGKQPPVPPVVPAPEPFDFSSPSRPTTPVIGPPVVVSPPASSPPAASPAAGSPPVIGPPVVGPPVVGPPPPAEHGTADRIAPDRTALPHLAMPLEHIDLSKLAGNFDQSRDGHKHEAIDIMAPRGTPIRAVAQGNVAKLFTSKRGGITVYQFDDSRTFCYYYAHLDHYAKGLQEGSLLRAGDVLGYVGSTGDASPSAPHLHFAVFKLGPEKKWWEGTPIDPLPLFH